MKKRNGWSALNSTEGSLIRKLTSLPVPAAASVPCSFISTKDLWKTLDRNRFLSIDIPEKSALLWLKASLIPILLRVDLRSISPPQKLLARENLDFKSEGARYGTLGQRGSSSIFSSWLPCFSKSRELNSEDPLFNLLGLCLLKHSTSYFCVSHPKSEHLPILWSGKDRIDFLPSESI